jgi:hypothetical protein
MATNYHHLARRFKNVMWQRDADDDWLASLVSVNCKWTLNYSTSRTWTMDRVYKFSVKFGHTWIYYTLGTCPILLQCTYSEDMGHGQGI